jgi:hypothetical protein
MFSVACPEPLGGARNHADYCCKNYFLPIKFESINLKALGSIAFEIPERPCASPRKGSRESRIATTHRYRCGGCHGMRTVSWVDIRSVSHTRRSGSVWSRIRGQKTLGAALFFVSRKEQ